MKSTQLLVIPFAIAAVGIGCFAGTAANAQGMMPGQTSGMVKPMASEMDRYMASWVFRNLDHREVRRYQSMGMSDWSIKAAANIAMRTGLDMPYVVRMHHDAGYTFYDLASMFNVNLRYVDMDIPGYGAGEMMMMMPAKMSGSSSMLMPSSGAPMTATSMTATASTTMASPAATGTVIDAISNNPDLSTLSTAIKAAGLTDTLTASGPFTVFAPSNEAFAKLPAGTVDDWLKPENQDKLRAALCYHVIPGKVMAADVMSMSNPSMPKTVNGAPLTVKTTAPVMINDANVTQTDIVASNGVIHVIDTVLMPPAAQ